MTVGSVSETVTVDIRRTAQLNTSDATLSTVVDRRFVENLPLNGRSFQSLILLSPGVVMTKANFAEQGQFSINGQRANANYYTVDGVSANFSINAGAERVRRAPANCPQPTSAAASATSFLLTPYRSSASRPLPTRLNSAAHPAARSRWSPAPAPMPITARFSTTFAMTCSMLTTGSRITRRLSFRKARSDRMISVASSAVRSFATGPSSSFRTRVCGCASL